MSWESVRIAPRIAALNDLDVLDCDIQNTYLTLDWIERKWVVADTNNGSKAGNNMLMRKALYGLTRSVTAFRAFLEEIMDAIGYRPSYTDPELWLWPALKPDGFKYYEYILF